jgi:hypothetical protein
MSSPHLTERQLTLYLDGELGAAERQSVRTHLDACSECRAEERAVRALLAAAPQSSHRSDTSRGRGWAAAAALAAAGIAALLIVGPYTDTPVVDDRRSADERSVLQPHHPVDGADLTRHDLRFAWAAYPADSYQITITAEDGALVWTTTQADTTVVPPADLELPPARYYWYVDAIGIGVVGRSGARSFTVVP